MFGGTTIGESKGDRNKILSVEEYLNKYIDHI